MTPASFDMSGKVALRGGGAVILVSSIAAFKGDSGLGASAVSKAAEIQLVRSFAVEWGASGVRAYAIAPGLVRTEFARPLWEDDRCRTTRERITPLRRIGEPGDIAGAAVFLASGAGAYVTGQCIVVDGGATIADPGG